MISKLKQNIYMTLNIYTLYIFNENKFKNF